MRRGKPVKKAYRFLAVLLAVSMTALQPLPVFAEKSDEIQNQIDDQKDKVDDTKDKLDALNEQLSELEDEEAIIEEEMDDIKANLVDTMAEIALKEDEISAKQNEITVKQGEIDETQKEYDQAVIDEQNQYDAMVSRARITYERGNPTVVSLLLSGTGLADVLNHLDYIEKIYEYDRAKLEEYTQAKENTKLLWDKLETEKAELQVQEAALQTDLSSLESSKAELEGIKVQLQAKFDDFEAQLAAAQRKANDAKKQLQAEKNKLRDLEKEREKALEDERKRREEEDGGDGSGGTGGGGGGGGTGGSSDYDSIIDSSGGSSTGKSIAKYACRFIGNPYVFGGTSLTQGTDCSGFTYRVYADFGYSIPRTSSSQRTTGTEVSLSEAVPGDIVCYSGHVGLYIGGGLIVHASTERTGIKVSRANYRTVLSVRRIVN